MFTSNRIILTISLLTVVGLNAYTQEIKGDTIYTSRKQQTSLYFRDAVTLCDYVETDAYNSYTKRVETYVVSIIARQKNPQSAHLNITEGGRNHSFIIAYKEDLSLNEADHDWENLRYLKEYVDVLEKKKMGIKTQPATPPNTNVVASSIAAGNTSPALAKQASALPDRTTDTLDYFKLLAKGIQAFDSKNFAVARQYFQKAREKSPNEPVVRGWLNDTENKLFLIEEDEGTKTKDEEFTRLVKAADESFVAQNYTLALQEYTKAQDLRPDDQSIKTRVTAARQKKLEIARQNESNLADLKYKDSVDRADKAVVEAMFKKANSTPDSTPNIKPQETTSTVSTQTNATEGVSRKSKAITLSDQKYIDSVNRADKALVEEMFKKARAAVDNPGKVKPKEKAPQIKPKAIEVPEKKQDTAIAIPNENDLIDQRYKQSIARADKALLRGLLEDARIAYDSAAKIKPSETYPQDKLKEVEDLRQKKEAATARQNDNNLKDQQYDQSIARADKALLAGMLQDARAAFDSASNMKPSEKYPQTKLKEIEGLERRQEAEIARQNENNVTNQRYTESITRADKAFLAGMLEDAQASFDSASKIKPYEKYPQNKLKEIEGLKRSQQAEIARLNEKNLIDQRYNEMIVRADKSLVEGAFEKARSTFDSASKIKPQERYPQVKLKDIEGLKRKQQEEISRLEKDAEFTDEVNTANQAYNAGSRDIARIHYERALKIKKDSAAEDQIKKIYQYKRDSIQTAKLEELTLAREKVNTEKYNSFKDKGDKAFSEQNFEVATNNYRQALTYKDEQFAKDRLTEIDTRVKEIDASRERAKLFNTLVLKGRAALDTSNYTTAKFFYEEALKLNNADTLVLARLQTIDYKIEELRVQKEQDDKYDSAVAKATQALADQAYNNAVAYYKEAGAIKPQESYPAKMVTYVSDILAEIEERRKVADELKRKAQLRTIMFNANKAKEAKNYDSAIALYKTLLALNPTVADQEFAAKTIANIELEQQRINAKLPPPPKPEIVVAPPKNKREARDRQKEEERVKILAEAKTKKQSDTDNQLFAQYPMPANTVIQNPKPVNNTNVAAASQVEAIPYSHDVLVKKYPNINFDQLPAGQTYDSVDRRNRSQIYQVSNKVLAETPRINYNDSSNYVKLTCQRITFSGSNAYIKLLIQNFSTTDFLTGAVQLKLIKNDGSTQELNQRFVSDFPVVMPKKEFAIVYVTDASVLVGPADSFILEMNDRIKNTKLRVSIPGHIYNQQKTAKL